MTNPSGNELRQLVELCGLHELRPSSKDSIEQHARFFVDGFLRYSAATRRLYRDAAEQGGAIDIAKMSMAVGLFELPATLYSLGLVGTLARAFIAERDRAEALTKHLKEQSTHLQTRIGDGDSMGASVWRIALEDAIRENRVALEETAE